MEKKQGNNVMQNKKMQDEKALFFYAGHLTINTKKEDIYRAFLKNSIVIKVSKDNENYLDFESDTEVKKYKIFKPLEERLDEDAKEATDIAKEHKDEIAPTDDGRVIHAEKEVKKKSSKFMNYFYAICLIVNIVSFSVILFIVGKDIVPLKELLSAPNASSIWLLLALLCFVGGMLVESSRFYILILKSTKKNRPYVSYKVTAIGRFYDLITPLSTGGQPFQISYLNKHGIGGATASSVPVAKYIFSQFTYLIAVVLLLVFGGVIFEGTSVISGFVSITAYIGLAVQFVILIAVILLSNSKKIGPAIVIGIFKVANKLKFIKDYKATYVKVLKFCYEYQTAMRSFISNFWTFISMFFSSVLVFLFRVSIPFCIYSAFFGFDPSMYLTTVARIMLCELAMGVWILPGNVIFADVAFLALFKSIFPGSTLFYALLFWRILSYYSYIGQGFVVKIYDKIKYGIFKAKVTMHNDIPDVGAKKKLRKQKKQSDKNVLNLNDENVEILNIDKDNETKEKKD